MKVKNHIDKAKHNERFVSVVESEFKSDFIDWCITALFYSALHYLSAFISYTGTSVPSDHTKRKVLLNPDGDNTLNMEYIPYEAYIELSEYSHKTRYFNHYSGRVTSVILRKDLEECKSDLEIIKQFVQKKGVI